MSEAKHMDEDEKFQREWSVAAKGLDYFTMAHVLSKRLRVVDKRAREANRRADALEAEIKRLKVEDKPDIS